MVNAAAAATEAVAAAAAVVVAGATQYRGHGSPGSHVSHQVLNATVQSCQKARSEGPRDTDQEQEV